jgi:hypothetical protein
MNWQTSCNAADLEAAVAGLKATVEAAYYRCDDDKAGNAHDELVAAEWRLRQARRRK